MTVRDSITRTGARTPGAEDYPTSMAAHGRASHPTQCGITEVASMCARGRHKPNISRCMPGAGLSRPCAGRCCPTCQPSSRIGENPPYGMIGRVEETSASFEARSAPRLYPTERLGAKFPGPTRQFPRPTRSSHYRSATSRTALPPAADKDACALPHGLGQLPEKLSRVRTAGPRLQLELLR